MKKIKIPINLQKGTKVFWTDPEEMTSGIYCIEETIEVINEDDFISLVSEDRCSYVEVFIDELELIIE